MKTPNTFSQGRIPPNQIEVNNRKNHNKIQAVEMKTLANLEMYTIEQIREFRNEIGPEANYMEIFLFAHFSRRQSRDCNQYI